MMDPQLDPAVLDMLRGSALAPLIDRPVNDILKDMGLPQLPDLPALPPLPDMPPMPVIDLAALARPLTDMASSFGTGTLGAAAGGGPDPTQVLSGITSALQSSAQIGSTALQTVMSIWQGMASMAAADKAAQAQSDAAELSTQSVQEKAVLVGGATSVATGAALLAAVIAKFMAQAAASAPFLSAPGGQAFLAAATAQAITEALAVVTKTRVELTGHSANMTQAGKKVDITAAPKGVDSLQQVMQMLTPLMTAATTMSQTASQLASANTALAAKPLGEPEHKEFDSAASASTKPGGGGTGGGGGVGGVGAAAAPLGAWNGGARGGGLGPVSGANTGTSSAATGSDAVLRAPGSSGPGMMPLGAAGAAGAARGAGDAGDMPTFLVNAEHGDDVVGDIDGVSLPVVGATENVSEPPPDKELTL
ncbi:hypothetical protein [Nocardia sp. NPDC050710]|uniref:hypothetical protein n=1 Tax=Nocardia sp. NPDC050710 TaxID=3157220 RepID=UPI00340D05F8